ncbi:hypothetical protein, partial [Bacteroides fragilis]
ILSQEEKEYFQLFNDMIVALYADSTIEPLLAICRQCITKEAEIFSSMSKHLEKMRQRNNDIQNAQYLKNLVNGVISILGNENIVLYDNIEELDVQLRRQIKVGLATFKSLDNEFVKDKSVEDICKYIVENSFLKELDVRLILGLKKLYSDINVIGEYDKDVLIILIKYFLYDMQHKVKYNYINMLIIENQEQPIIEDKANTLQSFLFYAQRTAGIRYKKIVVNEAVLLSDDAIMEIEKETSVSSTLSKDVTNEKNRATVELDKEKILEKLCPSFNNREQVKKILEKVDERFEITVGECSKLDIATLCLILKEKCSLFNRNIKNFSDFKEYVCLYYGVVNPSYKKNDCIVGSGTSPSRFDELYNDNGAFWNLCLRKNNQF